MQMTGIAPFYGTPEGGELARQAFFLPTLGLGIIEFVTMIPIMLFVNEGRKAPSREGRSWVQVALGAWGTDILRERSYIWLLVSRLFFLMAPSVLLFLGVYYLNQTFGIALQDTGGPLTIVTALIGVTTGLTTFPAARLSDRFGRKPIIYAAAFIGFLGMIGVMLAPSFAVMAVAVIPVGVSAGAFLAVDWALMTDIIPKATSGRYMGISNVATALAGPMSRISAGFLLTGLVLAGLTPELRALKPVPAAESTLYAVGPRLVMGLSLIFFVISVLALRNVDERRRDD
jgi:MFS family permease